MPATAALPWNPTERFELGGQVDILEDPGHEFSLDQVRHLPSSAFSPNPHGVISIGRSPSTFWLRFKLPPGCSPDREWLLEMAKAGIGALDLHIPMAGPDQTTRYTTLQFGSWRPRAPMDIPSRMQVISLPTQWKRGEYFYLKVKSDISINFPLRLFSGRSYIEKLMPDLYGFGILFGIFMGMILYNLSIYLFLRDATYLFYVLYILSMFLYITLLYGHFELFFAPDPTVLNMIFLSVTGASWLFGCVFVRLFLNTRAHTPYLDKVLLVLAWLSLLPMLFFLCDNGYMAHKINAIHGAFCPPIAILTALRVWRKGFEPAKYFLAAWTILVFGIMLYSMGGILIPRTAVTIYTVAVGAGVESILLSLALAHRIRLLQQEKESLLKKEQHLRRQATTDAMTGLYNRRFLLEALDREIRLAKNGGRPLSLLMVDVDNFKHFNDTHGHPEGDKVLVALARVFFSQLREKDTPCRYGGEEFTVLLPETDAPSALGVARRIAEAFSQNPFHPPGGPVRVTISTGLAQFTPDLSAQDLISRADQALYQAKQGGKNRVKIFNG